MLQQLSIQHRFRLLLFFSLACFALCGTIVYRALEEIRVNGPIYQRIMQGQDLVADILPPPAYIIEAYLVTLQMERADPAGLSLLTQRLRQLQREYAARHRYWQAQQLDGALATQFLGHSHALASQFYDLAFGQLLPALQQRDAAGAASVLAQLGTTYARQRAVIEQVVQLAQQRNQRDERAARDRMQVMMVSLSLVFGLTVMVFILIFNTVHRSIAKPLQDAVGIARKIAAGDWAYRFRPASNDEAGQLLLAIKEIVRNTQGELVKSEKLAALGSLVAGVSHELNTPVGNSLMAVSTLSEELSEFRGKLNTNMRRSTLDEFLHTVETGTDIATRNLQRAAELMRSFKQVAVDRASSQRRSFTLQQVLQETQMAISPMLRQASCLMQLQIPPEITLDSFPGPLGQVISNMVENAVRHGNASVVTVAAQLQGGGKRVQISVSDNGSGIPAALQAHVFEPFFTTRLGQGGSGLGLHIAHNIVYELLGGTIALRSEGGQGTRFEITLPLQAPRTLAAA
ncbi:MAG: sensor histidine kinase [Sphingomonadaceae bacterium]